MNSGVEFVEFHDFHDSKVEYLNFNNVSDSVVELYEFHNDIVSIFFNLIEYNLSIYDIGRLLNQPTKLILTTKSTRVATKNSASFLKFLFSSFLSSNNKTMTPSGQNIPVRKAFFGKSSPTTIL